MYLHVPIQNSRKLIRNLLAPNIFCVIIINRTIYNTHCIHKKMLLIKIHYSTLIVIIPKIIEHIFTRTHPKFKKIN